MFAKKHTSMFGAFAIDSKASRGRHALLEGRAQPARCAFEGSAGQVQAFASERVSRPLSFDEGEFLVDGYGAYAPYDRATEQYAAEDKARKEEVDTRNAADQTVYQTEKTVKDLGDKISAEDKATIEKKTEAVKEALKGTDDEMIKAATDDLAKVSMEIFGKVYQSNAGAAGAAGPDMGGAAGAGAAPDDGVVDADYREVDDN